MKKSVLMVLSLVMIAVIALTGTIAYLTSTDEAVNVMTMGNVKIEQHEYQRAVETDGTYKTDTIDNRTSYVLESFKQSKALLPAIIPNSGTVGGVTWDYDSIPVRMSQVDSHGGASVFNTPNAVDKFVTVENTGKSDAYVRTLVAFEVGTAEIISDEYPNEPLISSEIRARDGANNQNGEQPWTFGFKDYITVDGNKYLLYELIYTGAMTSSGWKHENGVLPAGDTTYPNLCQVYMASRATNEDVEAIDGNKNGTYDILVYSQAVQADGFENAKTALDTAFGEITATTHPWSEEAPVIPTVVETAEELTKALTEGESVILNEDVTVNSTIMIAKDSDVEINLNGNDISYAVENEKASAIINNTGALEIVGEGTISFVAANPDMQEIPAYATNTITNTGTLVIGEGVVVTNGSEGGASYAVDNHGKFTLNGGTLIGDRCALRIAKYNADGVEFVMNGGKVEAKTPAWIQLPGSSSAAAPKISVTINDGTFVSTKATSADNDVMYTYSFGNSHANTSITINGGEFLGGTVSIGSGYKGDVPAININGGTFEYDVLQWLANDATNILYKANK